MAISKRATKMVRRGGARFTSCKSLLNKEDCDHYKNRFKYVCEWHNAKSKCVNTKIISYPISAIGRNDIDRLIMDMHLSIDHPFIRSKKLQLSSLIYEEIRARIQISLQSIINTVNQLFYNKTDINEQDILQVVRYVPGFKINGKRCSLKKKTYKIVNKKNSDEDENDDEKKEDLEKINIDANCFYFDKNVFQRLIDDIIRNGKYQYQKYSIPAYKLIQFEVENSLKKLITEAIRICFLLAKRNTLYPRDLLSAKQDSLLDPRPKILPSIANSTFEKEYQKVGARLNIASAINSDLIFQLDIFNLLLISYILNTALIEAGNKKPISKLDMMKGIAFTLQSRSIFYANELFQYFLKKLEKPNIEEPAFNIKTNLKMDKEASFILNRVIDYINAEILDKLYLDDTIDWDDHDDHMKVHKKPKLHITNLNFIQTDLDFEEISKKIGFLPDTVY